MSTLPAFSVSFGLVMLVAGVILAIGFMRVVRARRQAKRRVVELPNSHYSSQLVRDGETRHRWRGMALDRIHEINREEVVRLLAKIEAIGIDGLRPEERSFLDRMAELAGTTSPVEPHVPSKPVAPDLRPRHA